MRRLLFVILLLSLCSCSDEHKAKRFIKKLDGQSEYLFKDINKTSASVYYEKDYEFHKYNIRSKKDEIIFQLTEGTDLYLMDNSHLGKGDVFYMNAQRIVYRYNLISREEQCLNEGDNTAIFLGGWNNALLFFDNSNMHNCDKCIIHYDTEKTESHFVTFNDFQNPYFDLENKKFFETSVVVGHNGLLVILAPDYLTPGFDDGLDLQSYLFHYNFNNPNGSLDLLCPSDKISVGKMNDETIIVVNKNWTTTVIYDLNAKAIKEFPSIEGWPSRRGLTSGNMIAKSDRYNLLCYIANDDDAFISSINLYCYDGNTGEEFELDSFKNADGEKIRFVMGSEDRKHIYPTSNGEGLVFCGETDFMNEYALLYFNFTYREIFVIDRGESITFTRNRFKVEHHNGTEVWYNTDGLESKPKSEMDRYLEDLFDYGRQGRELGSLINSFFGS